MKEQTGKLKSNRVCLPAGGNRRAEVRRAGGGGRGGGYEPMSLPDFVCRMVRWYPAPRVVLRRQIIYKELLAQCQILSKHPINDGRY